MPKQTQSQTTKVIVNLHTAPRRRRRGRKSRPARPVAAPVAPSYSHMPVRIIEYFSHNHQAVQPTPAALAVAPPRALTPPVATGHHVPVDFGALSDEPRGLSGSPTPRRQNDLARQLQDEFAAGASAADVNPHDTPFPHRASELKREAEWEKAVPAEPYLPRGRTAERDATVRIRAQSADVFKGFVCETCGRSFDTQRGLNIHKGKQRHPH